MEPPSRFQQTRSAPSSPLVYRRDGILVAPERRRVYESPRVQVSDEQIFPQTTEALRDATVRWQVISQQAGSHKQDGSVLRINRKRMTAKALKSGMPEQAAARVKELHLHLEEHDNVLPEWLDVIAATFPNLEDLYLEGEFSAAIDDEQLNGIEDMEKQLQNSKRLLRLYTLYRLPNLKSINGEPVTVEECKLARPDSPSGQKVKREDWIASSLLDDLEDDADCVDDATSEDDRQLRSESSGAVEVDLCGRVQLLNVAQNPCAHCNSTEHHCLLDELNDNDEKKEDSQPMPASARSLASRRHSAIHDQWETVSVESSTACEWSAACGSLSLPYFRGNRNGTPNRNKARFSLTLQRKIAIQELEEELDKSVSLQPRIDMPPLPLCDNQNSNEFRDILPRQRGDPRVQKQSIELLLEPTGAVTASHTKTETPSKEQRCGNICCAMGSPRMSPQSSPRVERYSPHGRPSPSLSLSSPFPMQFRVRGTSNGSRDPPCDPPSDVRCGESCDPPPPPPLPKQRLDTIPPPPPTKQGSPRLTRSPRQSRSMQQLPSYDEQLFGAPGSSPSMNMRSAEEPPPPPPPPPLRLFESVPETLLSPTSPFALISGTRSLADGCESVQPPQYHVDPPPPPPLPSVRQTNNHLVRPDPEETGAKLKNTSSRSSQRRYNFSTAIPPPPEYSKHSERGERSFSGGTLSRSVRVNRILDSIDAMATIETPLPLLRVKSSPSKLIRRDKSELPPPCPFGPRRVTALTKRGKLRKTRGTEWRQKQTARTTSIFDQIVDCESLDCSDDDMTSDEENIVIAS